MDDGTAWFLGERAVRYCVDVAPQFGLSAERATAEIAEALEQWQRYLLKKNVLSFPPPPPPSPPLELGLRLNHQYVGTCRSLKDKGDVDLSFYLGESSPIIEQIKRQFHGPLGFAHRVSYDDARGWGKGFIWINIAGGVPLFPGSHFPRERSG